MSREKNLSTIVKNERVRVHMIPGRYVFEPHGKATVELKSGGFDSIDRKSVFLETTGDQRMSPWTEYMDQNDPRIRLLEQELKDKPYLATHTDYQIRIVGEFETVEPWSGYDEMSVEDLKTYWAAMPTRMREQYSLASLMKWELDKDEQDQSRIDLINELHAESKRAEKDVAQVGAAI